LVHRVGGTHLDRTAELGEPWRSAELPDIVNQVKAAVAFTAVVDHGRERPRDARQGSA
jgi:hypothetical protein